MSRNYLVVNRISYGYVRSIADDLRRQFERHSPQPVEFVVCDRVDEVTPEAGSWIYVLGDPFGRFRRAPSCRYVFLNFSVLAIVGNPLRCSRGAWRLMSHKRRELRAKLDCFDAVLDYWPDQTAVLRRRLPLPTASFVASLPEVDAARVPALAQRRYDVCFVGTSSPRREHIADELRGLGLTLSPSGGGTIEDFALQSRVVLNVHMHRSNHVESPRLLSGFATGAAVVSEACPGLRSFPADVLLAAGYRRLARTVRELIADPARLEARAQAGRRWLTTVHRPACEESWRAILANPAAHFSLAEAAPAAGDVPLSSGALAP